MKKKRKTTTTKVRDNWSLENDICMEPGCRQRFMLETHEIIGSSDRPASIQNTAFFLRLCRTHHDQFGSRPSQDSLVRQLAVKKWADEENLDIAAVVKMWRPNAMPTLLPEIVAAVNAEYAIIVKEWT